MKYSTKRADASVEFHVTQCSLITRILQLSMTTNYVTPSALELVADLTSLLLFNPHHYNQPRVHVI